jgi:PKD repeat protein
MANNTDEDDDDLVFNWSFPGGTPASSTRKEVKVFFNTAGIFTVTLTATDSQGRVSIPVSRVITVTGPGNMAPTANIDAPVANVTVAQGGTVSFQGSGTDPDNNLPLTYSWNFGGGAPNSTVQNPGAVTFDTAGTFTVTFTVTDSLGSVSTPVTRTITVTAVAPLPDATIVTPAMNVSVLPGGRVTFAASGTGEQSSYRWSFPGGSPDRSTRQNPGAIKFKKAGVFTVSLIVTDPSGRMSAPVTRVITVASPNQSPRVDRNCLKVEDEDHHGERENEHDDEHEDDDD